jgi:hypothetical protein
MSKHKTPEPPFQIATDNLLWALLTGMENRGFEKLSVTNTPAVELTVPQKALAAVIIVEADATSADLKKVVRFREDGNPPTATDGMPLGDMNFYEVRGDASLKAFRIIGIEAGKTHTLSIQYYG